MSGDLLPRVLALPRQRQQLAKPAGDVDAQSTRRPGRRPSRVPLLADVSAALLACVIAGFLNEPAALVAAVAWVPAMFSIRRREGRSFGVGRCDIAGAARQGLMLVGIVAALGVLFSWTVSVLPLVAAMCVSVSMRMLDRVAPVRATVRGSRPVRVLVVGHAADVATFARQSHDANVVILGGCVGDPDSAIEAVAAEVLLLGDVQAAGAAAIEVGADAVIVLPGPDVHGSDVRELAWMLRDAHVQVAFAPAMGGIAAERLFVDSVDGRPLVSVMAPGPSRVESVVKSAVDRTLASMLLVLTSPMLLALAIAVRIDSRGPALFRQERVGMDGSPFTMLKFRTMCVDAEAKRSALIDANMNNDGLLFKVRQDPRVTRVGRVLRRVSLDELPQLINVARGEMSLVGPRPPLPAEVAGYDDVVARRLAVKPGLTGLWQVSGRSDLPWDESIRLDLDYVENWRPGRDVSIVRRTARAVFGGAGAY